jgi:putative spermidine/putrescine transport system ATP-binding protein/putrescine transport system ATP-binding protein
MTAADRVLELVEVTKRFGETPAVDGVSLIVTRGESVAVLGPSGCGKTTTLRLVAGFEPLDAGLIRIGGVDVSRRRPYERDVGIVFQDYALFPHMSVFNNVAYGLRRRGAARDAIGRAVGDVLSLVRLPDHAGRWPHQLSGGEQQRVAVARALAVRPTLLLLDEPFSNLDAKLRIEVRSELKEILTGVGSTTVLVTHDQEEAMAFGDRIVVMRHGRIAQVGAPKEIYDHPRSKFVAEFVGRSNWFRGRFEWALTDAVWRFVATTGEVLCVAPAAAPSDASVEVGLRPERLRLADVGTPAGPIETDLPGTVQRREDLGADVLYTVRLESGARMLVGERNVGQPLRAAGEVVRVRHDAQHCLVVEPEDVRAGRSEDGP